MADLLKMNLTEFWRAQSAVRVKSKLLGEDVYFASNSRIARTLEKGVAVWLPKELRFALEVSDTSLKVLNTLKRHFGGFIVKVNRHGTQTNS